MLLEKFSEIFSRHANVNIIVDLHGNTDAIALSDTKASRKHDLIVNMMLCHGILQQLHDLLRALQMA